MKKVVKKSVKKYGAGGPNTSGSKSVSPDYGYPRNYGTPPQPKKQLDPRQDGLKPSSRDPKTVIRQLESKPLKTKKGGAVKRKK